MATIVLVPGFWIGAWAWRRVTPLLRAARHEVYPLTLTGLADRVHLADPHVDVDTHISDIVNLIWYEDLHEVVLVGHSGGGVPVTGAAERIPERLARVVYVESGPLGDGVAQFDTIPPEEQARIQAEVKERGDGWRIPVPPFDLATDPVNHAGLTEQDAALIRRLGVPQPFPTATQSLRLTNPARRELPTDLVACTFPMEVVDEMLATGHPFFAEFGSISQHRVHALPTGHWPMLSRPDDLAAMLSTIAG